MKTCTSCKIEKPISEFYAYKGRPNAICKACKNAYSAARYEAKKSIILAQMAAKYSELRDEVFAAYGGYVCACCGETEPLFLTLDHVGNNGNEHRRELAGETKDYRSMTGIATYRALKKAGFPAGYQVLCSNCNHGKHRNGGVCPHQLRKEGSTTIAQASTSQVVGKCGAPS